MSKLNGKVIKKSIYSIGGNSEYSEGQTIQFKFPDKDGFLIPESLNISYTFGVTSSTAVYGMPLYAPISSLETYINDTCVEQINNYNSIFGFIVANGLYDAGSRVGMMEDYGLIYTGALVMENFNYGNMLSGVPVCYSGKLECMLRNFNGPIPFSKISPMIELNLDYYRRVCYNATGTFTLNNVEITYDVLYADIPIYKQLSTFSFFSNATPLVANTTGTFSLNFNNPKMKYGKGAFVTFSSQSTLNRSFESYDYTNFTGCYNLYFNNNKSYPQKTYYTSVPKRSAILTNYKDTIRKIYKNNNLNSYITYLDYNYAPNGSISYGNPSKFIFGVPLCNDYCDGLDIDSNTAILQISMTNTVSGQYLANLVICYGIDIDITENGLIISK